MHGSRKQCQCGAKHEGKFTTRLELLLMIENDGENFSALRTVSPPAARHVASWCFILYFTGAFTISNSLLFQYPMQPVTSTYPSQLQLMCDLDQIIS